MARVRKNLTLSPEILRRGEAIMHARGFDGMADLVSTLIREEYERRHPPVLPATAAAPIPEKPPSRRNLSREAVEALKKDLARKASPQK